MKALYCFKELIKIESIATDHYKNIQLKLDDNDIGALERTLKSQKKIVNQCIMHLIGSLSQTKNQLEFGI